MRYAIYLFGGWNSAPTFESALDYAKSQVNAHYERTGSLGESYAVIYNKLTQYRWLVFIKCSGGLKCKLIY